MKNRGTAHVKELGRQATVDWLAQRLRRLQEFGVRVAELPPAVDGRPDATQARSRYHQSDNTLEVAGCALCTKTLYARFATAQRNAFLNIGGYLLTGPESPREEGRRLHPRRHRAETTPAELTARNAQGQYDALHHVLARFTDTRMPLGHGPR